MLAAFNRFCNSCFAPRGSNGPTMPKSLNKASNLLNATNIDQVAGGVAFRWSIRTKESECCAGERRWLERGAMRTLVRERRLKVSLAARAARSVRAAQMKKSVRQNGLAKKQNRHGFPCLQHITWRRRGDSNPRDPGCGPNGFRDRRIQPLCHPSEGATKKVV